MELVALRFAVVASGSQPFVVELPGRSTATLIDSEACHRRDTVPGGFKGAKCLTQAEAEGAYYPGGNHGDARLGIFHVVIV